MSIASDDDKPIGELIINDPVVAELLCGDGFRFGLVYTSDGVQRRPMQLVAVPVEPMPI